MANQATPEKELALAQASQAPGRCIYCENLQAFGLLPRSEYQFRARAAFVFDPQKGVSAWTYCPPQPRWLHRDKYLSPLHAGVLCQQQGP